MYITKNYQVSKITGISSQIQTSTGHPVVRFEICQHQQGGVAKVVHYDTLLLAGQQNYLLFLP
jgi:hypothetical protein